MRRSWLAVCLASLAFLVVPFVRAGDKTADAPTIVVRIKSLDTLRQNLQLVVKLVGQAEAANQIEGLIKSRIGKNGLEGVDLSRPLGAYVRYGKSLDEISGAILLPMADEKTFLTLLDNIGVVYKKDKAGIYSYKNENVDVFFRFKHQYLYITSLNPANIQDKNLPEPAKALAVGGDAAISVVARAQHIPKDARLIALGPLKDAVQAAKAQMQPGETKTQAAFRVALLDEFHTFARSVIQDADEIRLDVDVKDGTLHVDVKARAMQGSALAKSIKLLGEFKSPLAGFGADDAAFRGSLHLALPDELNQAFGKVIEEVRDKSLESIEDKAKKAQARSLFDALLPTARAGEFQAAAALLGPQDEQNHFAILAALKVKDGVKLGKTVHDLLKDALMNVPDKDKGKFKLDADSVGNISIHRLEVPADPKLDKILKDLAGDNQLYLAFREDAVFLALGKGALPALKSALGKTDAVASPPLMFDVDISRISALMTPDKELRELAKGGRLSVAVDGGASLHARIQVRLNVLEFLMKLNSNKGQ
jgi:hypothetical protein